MTDLTSAKILADSVGPHGIRLTTMEIVFPRFILAELNTHRMLSRNSASSRAIPTEKQIDRVREQPFIPQFNARVKGMGVGAPLTDQEQYDAERVWLFSRDSAAAAAMALLHVDKSRANRLLEPFMWHTAIVSATEWENFFALRMHPDAQPEFRKLAYIMNETMGSSVPDEVEYGDWHLPMAEEIEVRPGEDFPPLAAKVSAGRCAKVSYDTHWREEPPKESKARWNALSEKGHWSPGEHPARCVQFDRRRPGHTGNFVGWLQLRKCYPNEAVFTG